MRPQEPGDPSRRPVRAQPREIVELKRLKANHPDLAVAADMQIALLELLRRVESRLPLPLIDVDPAVAASQLAAGQPLVQWRDLTVDWTEFALLVGRVAAILRMHDALEIEDHDRLQVLARNARALEPLAEAWYRRGAAVVATAGVSGGAETAGADLPPMFDEITTLAMRPFLARAVGVIATRVDVSAWSAPYCPFCGASPELAVITPAAERRLICGRCTAQWTFDPIACPFCGNGERDRITSFTSRDGQYRLYACDVCRRYLKAFDGRQATRPVMLPVDSVATLPLDAAAIQKGYGQP